MYVREREAVHKNLFTMVLMALGYRQSPILLPGIGSFMAQELIQDFCSSANTVAMGTKEQLPYN